VDDDELEPKLCETVMSAFPLVKPELLSSQLPLESTIALPT
jgi:hypothetical protein